MTTGHPVCFDRLRRTSAAGRTRVAIAGATGYAGQELVRILARHPAVTLTAAMSSGANSTPRPLPALARIWDGAVVPLDVDRLVADADIVFLALPEAASAELGAAAGRARCPRHRPVGRLPDPRAMPIGSAGTRRRRRCRQAPCTGFTERHQDAIRTARLVSNPGCYPTAALLALEPLARGRACSTGPIVIDAKSGISGAGKTPSDRTHFSENHGSVAAYGIFSHRHTAEIEQELGTPVTFVPHLVPLDRGILETIYASLTPGHDRRAGRRALQRAYADAPFVRLTGGDAARDQARRAYQLLRHRLEGRREGGAHRARRGHRQPGQRCGGIGGAEPECPARPRRAHGPAVKQRPGLSSSEASCSSSRRTSSALRRHRGAGARSRALVVVHGGGKEIDAALAAAGIPKQQVDGLRVTDARTLDVVVAVLAGAINTRLVAAVREAGGKPVGLTGADAGGRDGEARGADRQRRWREGRSRPGGRAGQQRIARAADGPAVAAATCRWWPASAATRDGQLLNVNADTLASHSPAPSARGGW